jgi:peptidyl-prolyl cis-trans isomerase SurA
MCWTAITGILVVLLPAAPAAAELIDRVVARVNTEVITLSELRQAETLNEAIGGAPRDRKAFESEILEGLINRELLLQEARRLAFAEATDSEVNAEMTRLVTRLGSEKALANTMARAGINDEELRRMLAERLMAERFLEKRVGLFVRVSRQDAEKYYREHTREFGSRPFRDAAKQITLLLTTRRTDEQIMQYLAELRARADVRANPLE